MSPKGPSKGLCFSQGTGSRIEPKTHNGITPGSELRLATSLIGSQIEFKALWRLSHIGTAFAV
nr:hypothetical protein CKG001_00670 [Bdellovibrio sp. CKG001]BFD61387.1 hypothetical protein BdHM001_00680 [Bdellovibrio sp. HM001]BFD65046.1 hypothetical protein HAGR004_00680 [Bdellovibrio sp. HAGR004]